MRTIISILFFGFIFELSFSQVEIKVKGNIDNYKNETLLIGSGNVLNLLQLSSEGNFEMGILVDQFPYMIQLMSSSKKGKLTYLSPIIWLDEKSPVVNFDIADNSYESSSKLPYQSISENIEQLKEKEQIDYILKILISGQVYIL